MKLIAVDVGNSAIKIAAAQLAGVGKVQRVSAPNEIQIDGDHPSIWCMASVDRDQAQQLQKWLSQNRPRDRVRELSYRDIPLKIRLPQPERVGIDRLCAALAAHQRAQPRPCIVVDAGTAITVDAVAADGTFLGGTIFLGLLGALDHLAAATDALPRLKLPETPDEVDAIGQTTEQAMKSGVLLAAAGGISEIVQRQSEILDETAQVFLTGGTASALRPFLRFEYTWVDPLVLEGIIAAGRQLDEVHA